MTENDPLRPEDFEPHRVEAEPTSGRATFQRVWKEQPLVRLGLIFLPVVAVVAVVVGIFGSKPAAVAPAKVTGASSVISGPGPLTASDSYINAVKQNNDANKALAETTGTSNIPNAVPALEHKQETASLDPLQFFKPQPVVAPPPPPLPSAPTPASVVMPQAAAPIVRVDPNAVQAIAAQMKTILGGLGSKAGTIITINHASAINPPGASQANDNGGTRKQGGTVAGSGWHGGVRTDAHGS